MGLKLLWTAPRARQGSRLHRSRRRPGELRQQGRFRSADPLAPPHRQAQEGGTITLLTNDLDRPAVDIAQLYKGRWQIELLFRWIKQHLKIRNFLGNNDNAIRLQLFAAMIAYALLRMAARAFRMAMPILRFTDLVAQCQFDRRRIDTIDKPPPVNPSHQKTNIAPTR